MSKGINSKGISPLLATVLKPLFFVQKAKLSDNSRSFRLFRVRKEKSLGFKRKYYTKGISPLLATVLLIATTVVVSTMLAGWVSSTTSATQNTISNRTSEGVACTAAEIVIDDVYSGAGSGSIARAIVRNSGGSDNLAITSAQLYDRFGNNFTTVNTLPTNLNKGQMATLNFNYSILPTLVTDNDEGISNGTLMNGTLWTLNGKYGSALNFDGIDDYVNMSDTSLTLNITQNITVEAWIKWNGGGCSYAGIVSRRVGSNFNYELLMTDTGSAGWGINNTGHVLYVSNAISANNWYYLTGTYNGTNYSLYSNGILINSGAINENRGIDTQTVIGNDIRYNTCNFNGTIDDVAIWNRTLSNAEINTSMSTGPLSVSNTNDLVGYWKFDEGKGVLSCPSDFSRVVVTTNCGGVSAEFTKPPKC